MTTRYLVLDIVIDDAAIEEVNRLGWGGAIEKYPKVKAYLDKSLGADKYDKANFKYYEFVGFVTADSLEDAFLKSNMGGDPSAIDNFTGKMTSLSVGNILVDEYNKVYIVDTFGFKEIEID